jgi:hypothetical protein
MGSAMGTRSKAEPKPEAAMAMTPPMTPIIPVTMPPPIRIAPITIPVPVIGIGGIVIVGLAIIAVVGVAVRSGIAAAIMGIGAAGCPQHEDQYQGC